MGSDFVFFLVLLILKEDPDVDCNLEQMGVTMVYLLALVVEELDSMVIVAEIYGS